MFIQDLEPIDPLIMGLEPGPGTCGKVRSAEEWAERPGGERGQAYSAIL